MEAKSSNFTSSLSNKGADIFECPSCNLRLKSITEVAKHCELEIEKLRQMPKDEANNKAESTKTLETNEDERRKPYSVFQRVQRNRQTRLKRLRKRATPPAAPTEHSCPICQQLLPANEIHSHVERCLRKSNGHTNGGDGNSSNEDEDAEDGYGEEYEEYEWAGQKRIRASSLLEGGYSSLGIGQQLSVIRNGSNDTDEEDLNVDEDDTQIYGPAQYNEADVISTEGDASSYMRSLITGQTSSQVLKTDELNREMTESTNTILNCQPSSSSSATPAGVASFTKPKHNTSHLQHIIESLKTKLRYYENHIPSKYKCLICLDEYKKPAISVSCWHVHCEDCWLRSLGARKLCPQCNLITTPKDLRRIYM